MADPLFQKLVDGHFADARMFAGKLSDAARYVWVGSFGLLFAGLTATTGTRLDVFYRDNAWFLALAAALGALAFGADTLKSVLGLRQAEEMQAFAMEKGDVQPDGLKDAIAAYNAKITASRLRWWNNVLLWISAVTALASAGFIVMAAVHQLFWPAAN